MPVRKIAISVSQEVLGRVDQAAAERGLTRSRFITQMLDRLASAQTDREVKRRIDLLFADPDIQKEQRRAARAGQRAMAKILKDRGTTW